MNSTAIRAAFISVALCATLFGVVGRASASHVSVELVGLAQLSVGHAAQVRAVVRNAADGRPVAGTTVTFYVRASFAGVTSNVEIGKAVTGEDGAAVLSYEPRSEGSHELRAEITPDGGTEPEEARWVHDVEGSAPQIYRSTAGVGVPGFDGRVLMVVVSVVWLILFSVVLRVIAIARAGADAAPGPEQQGGVL